jgi:predicted protein tyrosine phosphatase
MSLRNVIFTGREEAEARKGWRDWAVISITEPGYYPANLQSGWNGILRLEFHDIDAPREPYVLFTNDDAAKIIEFVARMHGNSCEGIMVHCKAGISRSAAVAKYIARKHNLPFNNGYSLYNKLVYNMLIEAEAGSFL